MYSKQSAQAMRANGVYPTVGQGSDLQKCRNLV
jgi:hypothetical protein